MRVSIIVTIIGVAASAIALSAIQFSTGNEGLSSIIDREYSPTFAEGNIEGWKECVVAISDRRFENKSATSSKPFTVHLAWDTYNLKSQALAEFEILVTDSVTGEPLSDVTYDFTHKGARDLGVQDRYVADFSDGPDIFELQVKHPCSLHFIVFVDKVGSESFLLTDPDEIERLGNVSPVFAEFRMTETEEGGIEMIVV